MIQKVVIWSNNLKWTHKHWLKQQLPNEHNYAILTVKIKYKGTLKSNEQAWKFKLYYD